MALIRMAFYLLSLLLLLQLPTIFATGHLLESKVCGELFAYSDSYGVELFYINGNSVGKHFFCEALKAYHERDCNFKGYIGNDLCQFELSTDGFFSKANRRLLQKGSGRESVIPDGNSSHEEEEKGSEFVSSSEQMGVLAAGSVLTCCVFLCPCFFKKRKDTSDAALTKDPNLIYSSSFDAASTHEKIPQSPYRVPPSPRLSISPQLNRMGSIHITMSQALKATRNFSTALRIGEGGFGTVYKAHLEDGNIVAIKRGKREHFENLRNEFSSEIELLAKIDHRNLVKLLGYVDQGDERLIITEYVPNGTLREHLDGQRGKILDFNQRLEIAIDIAHGLTYLHLYTEKPIIHRDVKSSNILLTERMRAKVADFGFAKVGPMDTEETHVMTQVKGTVGYLDPEYMKTYKLTVKSDVYSFGVLLIEILTGRRPVEFKRPLEERVTPRWAFSRYEDERVVELVDPLMNEAVDLDILRKIFALAFDCVAPVRSHRPDMKLVGEQLWTIRADFVKKSSRTG